MINVPKNLDYTALKRMFILGIIIIFFSVIPRESRTKLTYIIKNNSKKTILLKNKVNGDTIVLHPESFVFDYDIKETSLNYIKNDLFKNKNICTCYGNSFDIVAIDTFLKVTKKTSNISDWEYLEEKNILNDGGKCICRFTISDSDIVN